MQLSIATSFKEQCLKSDVQLREALQPVIYKSSSTNGNCVNEIDTVQAVESLDIQKLV